jgi:NADH-quinone oxidoreductase subunit M
MPEPAVVLLLLLVLPAAAAAVVALLGPRRGNVIRWLSLITSVVSLALTAHVATNFALLQIEKRDAPAVPMTFVPLLETKWDVLPLAGTEALPGSQPSAIRFHIGVDGLNVWLIALTTVLMLPSVLVSWTAIQDRVNEFYAWLLLLQSAIMGVFLSFDIIVFYAFFELSLVPLFFLIGIWGGPQKRHAARKFFVYTLVGSLVTMLGVIGVVLACYDRSRILTFSIPELVRIVHQHLEMNDPAEQTYWANVQMLVFFALMAGFAVKVPLVPFHTWLPLAHVEAPTAGSVDLAGIVLKIGAYGFLRLCIPLAPDASLAVGLPLVSTLAAIGIVYGAFCAFAQDDVKKMIAYSSVSHLGLCMLGMFALNAAGLAGSLLQMINHGLSSAALFLLIGMLYERYHTRKQSAYGGMAQKMPRLAILMVFVCLTSVGLPGLNGFVGEALSLFGIFEREWTQNRWPIYAVVGASGIVLGAWYLFTMLRRVFFGPFHEPSVTSHDAHSLSADLNPREVLLMAPIVVLCVAIGVFPQPILDASQRDLNVIVDIAERAQARERKSTQTAGSTDRTPQTAAGLDQPQVDQWEASP